jgi:hypothetical protein
MKAPMIVPIKAMAMVKPWLKSDRPYTVWMDFSAPDITAVSNPKSNPPRDATKAM